MRILVTRPASEAAVWVRELSAHGHEAFALPLIEIAPAAQAHETERLQQAWQALSAGRFSAVMFSSTQAVHAFFASGSPDIAPAAGVHAWAPGPGTARALEGRGFASVDSPANDAAQFDSEHLWQVVSSQVGPRTSVLGVRGSDAAGRAQGREWLRRQVESAGGAWDDVVAYRRLPPQWNDAQRALARNATGPDAIWLLSSSEAVRNLGELLPDGPWPHARAIATHPRIAEAATALGFGRVEVSAPALPSVLASIESLR
jgi:uroporphyrinogen-III synthase